jgi:hypothetical protein
LMLQDLNTWEYMKNSAAKGGKLLVWDMEGSMPAGDWIN